MTFFYYHFSIIFLNKGDDMNNNNNNNNSGIGFTGLLTVLFIGLKLTGYIAWSWWWVLAPLWIGLLVVLTIIAVILSTTAGVALFKG